MKSFTFSAAIVAVATAANARQNSRELLGRNAAFSGAYAGLNERELPDFADPYTPKGESNQIVHELREGDDFIPKEVQAAEAAQRDPVIALTPKYNEPIDPNNKVFLSPVFISEPEFTDALKDQREVAVFRGNDHAGWRQPKVHSRFPIVTMPVRKFFHVGADCKCDDAEKPVEIKEPKYNQ